MAEALVTIPSAALGFGVGYVASIAADGMTERLLNIKHKDERLGRIDALAANSLLTGAIGGAVLPLLNPRVYSGPVGYGQIVAYGSAGEAAALVASYLLM
jgi:hypothetical protein